MVACGNENVLLTLDDICLLFPANETGGVALCVHALEEYPTRHS